MFYLWMHASHDKAKWITFIIFFFEIFKSKKSLGSVTQACQLRKKLIIVKFEQLIKIFFPLLRGCTWAKEVSQLNARSAKTSVLKIKNGYCSGIRFVFIGIPVTKLNITLFLKALLRSVLYLFMDRVWLKTSQ